MPEINGTESGEYIAGTDSDDVIRGFGGNDQISAFYGNDLIYPGAGKDYVQADVGDDTIILADPMEYADFFPMRVYEEFYGGSGFDTIEMQNFTNSGLNSTNSFGLVSSYALSSAWALQGIERLAFSSSAEVGVYATIQHGQVASSGITHLTGGAGRDILVIWATYSATFDMPAFTLTNWQSAPADLSSGDVIALMAYPTTDMVLLTAREGLGATQALYGNNGNDTLTGSSSADMLDGGAGNDTMIGNGGGDRMVGGLGNDVFFVDAGATVIENAGEGNDRVVASANYVLAAGAEVETIETGSYTGTGAINLTGSDTANTIFGNNGLNTLFGQGGADTLHGFAGADYLFGGTELDNMYGGAGDDAYYIATADGDRIWEFAGEGYDTVSTEVDYELPDVSYAERLEAGTLGATTPLYLGGSNQDNLIIGNAGNNTLRGFGGADTMHGLGGDDVLIGDAGADVMYGGAGNDTYYINTSDDRAFENPGEGTNDRVAIEVSFTLPPEAEIEVIEAVNLGGTAVGEIGGSNYANTITGDAGNNLLRGYGGNDTLTGSLGNDTLVGDEGNDTMSGGAGDDVYFVDAVGDVIIEAAGEGNDRVATSVSYALSANAEVETLETTNAGATSALDLTGSASANIIVGNAGANVLDGKDGNDLLNGLGGADTFAFTTTLGAGNVDQIDGFVSATDTIALDDAVFATLAPGALSAAAFVSAASAQDADDRIVYNSATGALYFDADGNGAGAAVQFATLAGAPSLTAADFVVI